MRHESDVAAGALVHTGLGGRTLERRAETSTAVLAAQAEAEVKARYSMAQLRPRDLDNVRVRTLKHCQRSGFAKTAIWRRKIGIEQKEGPSIRLAETLIREMGNLDVAISTLYDDPEKRILECAITDLETNARIATSIVVMKTSERRDPRGRDVLSERENSYGERTYTVIATEDELLVKTNALVSKAMRTNALRLVPADLLDEALAACRHTRMRETEQDPDKARKALSDAFAPLGVLPSDLKSYLGHELGQSSPAELEELRDVYQTVKDGATTWHEALRAKLEEREAQQQPPPLPEGAPQESGQGLDELLSALAAATTQAEVRDVGKRAKAARLDATAKERFDSAYTARMRDVTNNGGGR